MSRREPPPNTIVLENVELVLRVFRGQVVVFKDLSATIPTNCRLAILGTRKSGKSSLLRLLGKLDKPTGGSIRTSARVSFPIGQPLGLSANLTVAQNVSFAARLFGTDRKALLRFVAEMAHLEGRMHRPLRLLAIGEMQRFRLAVAYGLDFDVYLIDGSYVPRSDIGESRFAEVLRARAESRGLIFATGNVKLARQFCDVGAVLHNGQLTVYKTLDAAVDHFEAINLVSDALDARGDRFVRAAERAVRAGRADWAERVATEILEIDPAHEQARQFLDRIHARRAAAIEAPSAEDASSADDDILISRLKVARAAMNSNDLGKVKDLALELLSHHGEDSRAVETAAGALEKAGFGDLATNAWLKLARLNLGAAKPLLRAARLLQVGRRHSELLQVLDDVRQHRADGMRELKWRFEALVELGKLDDVGSVIGAIAALDRKSAYSHIKLLAKMGHGSAAKQLREAFPELFDRPPPTAEKDAGPQKKLAGPRKKKLSVPDDE